MKQDSANGLRRAPSKAQRPEAGIAGAVHKGPILLLGALLLVLVACAGVYFHHLIELHRAAAADIERLRVSLEENRRFLNLVVDLESAHRGFLLTGDPRQLESFEAAEEALPKQLDLLETLLSPGDDAFREMLAAMRLTLERKRQEMARLLERYSAAGQPSNREWLGEDLGQFETDSLRLSAQALEEALDATVARQRHQLGELIDAQLIATYLTLIIVALIGIATMLLSARHFEALRRQQQLRSQVLRSRGESEAKSAFLAHVSHEIRTPMNAIFSFSGLLRERLRDPTHQHYVHAITENARSLLSLIDDLLDLARIESGRVEIVPAPAGPREVIDGVLTIFSQQAANKGVALRSEIHPDVPAAVMMDADRLRQMLVNLVSNALKYTDVGEVVVGVKARAGSTAGTVTCRFEVRDSGIGIAPENLDTIFEPFAQGRAQQGHRVAGTGLGLSITRQLAHAMGGDVRVRSRPGRGSCFRIVLPALPVCTLHGTVSQTALRDLRPMRLLLALGTEVGRSVVAALLSGTKHDLRIAATADAAMEMIEEAVPDALLIDLDIPASEGMRLAQRLRADPRLHDARFIALSRTGAAKPAQDLFEAILTKPVSDAALALELLQEAAPTEGTLDPAAAERANGNLIVELDSLLQSQWPIVRDTPTVREVRHFADRVEGAARRHSDAALIRYARRLGTAAASFDVARIEVLLTEFPAHVTELRCRASAGAARDD